VCPVNDAEWSHPVWKQLQFQPFEPSAYRFSYESDGNTFVVRMVGDADCDGKSVTWVLRGAVDGAGNVQNDQPPALPDGVS
jgi:hypothetical protein